MVKSTTKIRTTKELLVTIHQRSQNHRQMNNNSSNNLHDNDVENDGDDSWFVSWTQIPEFNLILPTESSILAGLYFLDAINHNCAAS